MLACSDDVITGSGGGVPLPTHAKWNRQISSPLRCEQRGLNCPRYSPQGRGPAGGIREASDEEEKGEAGGEGGYATPFLRWQGPSWRPFSVPVLSPLPSSSPSVPLFSLPLPLLRLTRNRRADLVDEGTQLHGGRPRLDNWYASGPLDVGLAPKAEAGQSEREKGGMAGANTIE